MITGPSGPARERSSGAARARAASSSSRSRRRRAPQRPGEQDGRALLVHSPRASSTRLVGEGAFLEHVDVRRRGQRYGTLALARSTGSAAKGKVPAARPRDRGRAAASSDEVPGAVTIFVDAPTSPSSSAGCASARPRAPARSSERIALARRQLEHGRRVRPRDRERRRSSAPSDELGAIVQRELDAAATMSAS